MDRHTHEAEARQQLQERLKADCEKALCAAERRSLGQAARLQVRSSTSSPRDGGEVDDGDAEEYEPDGEGG